MRYRRLDRREALMAGGAAVGSLFAAQTLAGSLEPPGGAPSPTGRSLLEIEPRVAVNGLAAGGGAMHQISAGGSYKLTGNIVAVGGAVTIRVTAADPVSIDLNGYTLDGGGGGGGGILVSSASPASPYVEIFDGYIRRMAGDAIDGGAAHALEVNDVHIDGAHRGIVGHGNLTIEACLIEHCAAEGIVWDKSSSEQSPALAIDDCDIIDGQAAGIVVGGDWSTGSGTASISDTDVVNSQGEGVAITISGMGAGGSAQVQITLQELGAHKCSGTGIHVQAPPGPLGVGASVTLQCEDVICSNNGGGGMSLSGVAVDLIDCIANQNNGDGVALESTRGSVDNCVATGNSSHGIHLLGSCQMSVSENAAHSNGGVGIRIAQGVVGTAVADNDVRTQAVGIQDGGTQTLLVRNTALGNGVNYQLGSTPAVIVTAAQLTTNNNPHANYSL